MMGVIFFTNVQLQSYAEMNLMLGKCLLDKEQQTIDHLIHATDDALILFFGRVPAKRIGGVGLSLQSFCKETAKRISACIPHASLLHTQRVITVKFFFITPAL
ncbi:MAG: hypothetical protein HY062_11330 [Bacteroidetes bacterium]|nr:hypothetical protein [Bacteroidota bacterium]